MNEGMPTPPRQEQNIPRTQFLSSMEKTVSELEAAGRLKPDQAAEKRELAQRVEKGFSSDPTNDGKLYAYAGVATEDELVSMLRPNEKGNATTTEPEQNHDVERREGTDNMERIGAIAQAIDELIQAYAKILRSKLLENHSLSDENTEKEPTARALGEAISNLEQAQTSFIAAFERIYASNVPIDSATIESVLQSTAELSAKLEKLCKPT